MSRTIQRDWRADWLAIPIALVWAASASAQLVFDNGGPNTLNTPTGDPPVAVEVRDNAGGIATSLTVEEGAVIGGGSGDSVVLFGQSVYVMTGGAASGDLRVNDMAEATISGGTFGDDLFVSGFGVVTLSVATFDDVTVTENGTVNFLPGAEILDDAFFRNSSRLVMSGGLLPDEVEIRDSATALFTGGVIGDDLVVAENAQVEIQFLEIDDAIEAEGDSRTDIYDGIFHGGVEAFGNAIVNINGGQFGPILAGENASVDIHGGTFDEGIVATQGASIHVTGATINSFGGPEIRSLLGSKVTVSNVNATELDIDTQGTGLVVLDDVHIQTTMSLNALGDGRFDVRGGSADELIVLAEVDSRVEISGGQFASADLEAQSGSVITIYGPSFTINGFSLNDALDPTGRVLFAAGSIEGTLRDGSPFSATFRRQITPPAQAGQFFIVLVPEPGTTALTMLALAGLLAWRRRGAAA